MILTLFIPDGVLAFFSPSPVEMMVVAVVALLLFGSDLPNVARSWGKSFTAFRRGLTGIQNEINDVIYSEPERLEHHQASNEPYTVDAGEGDAEDAEVTPAEVPADTAEAYTGEAYGTDVPNALVADGNLVSDGALVSDGDVSDTDRADTEETDSEEMPISGGPLPEESLSEESGETGMSDADRIDAGMSNSEMPNSEEKRESP
jgi:sec-independent protein translocase protein TatA